MKIEHNLYFKDWMSPKHERMSIVIFNPLIIEGLALEKSEIQITIIIDDTNIVRYCLQISNYKQVKL